jgi:hypothetical protein
MFCVSSTDESSLDRTNFVQDILSRTTLESYLLLVRREWIHSNSLWTYHRELWAENGDALSRIYAGTGALNTSFTRSGKRTLAGWSYRSSDGVLHLTAFDIRFQESFLMPQKAFLELISTTSKTKANK